MAISSFVSAVVFRHASNSNKLKPTWDFNKTSLSKWFSGETKRRGLNCFVIFNNVSDVHDEIHVCCVGLSRALQKHTFMRHSTEAGDLVTVKSVLMYVKKVINGFGKEVFLKSQ